MRNSPKLTQTYWPDSRVPHMPHGIPEFPAGLSMRLGACQPMPVHGSHVRVLPVGENPVRRGKDQQALQVRPRPQH